MIEAPRGVDLWEVPADAIVVTTNMDVNKSGRAVMGRGCAREAVRRYPGIDLDLGRLIRMTQAANPSQHGAHVQLIRSTPPIVSFPVKFHWHEDANHLLIVRSAGELVELTDIKGWETVVAPRFGCGNGRLDWKTTKHHVGDLLDDRFVIVHK